MKNQNQGPIFRSAGSIGIHQLSLYQNKSNHKIQPNIRYSKSQVKSASTLPSNNYHQSHASHKNILNIEQHAKIYKPELQRFKLDYSKLVRKPNTNSRHEGNYSGYIQTKSQITSHNKLPLDETSKLEQENAQLRSKLLDYELKERVHMQKIYQMEKLCAKLGNLLGKSHVKSKQESQFLRVINKTFNNNFGISDLKGIWRKEKQILKHWMISNQPQQKQKSKSRQTEGSIKIKKSVKDLNKDQLQEQSSGNQSISSLEIKIRSKPTFN